MRANAIVLDRFDYFVKDSFVSFGSEKAYTRKDGYLVSSKMEIPQQI